MKNTLLLPVAAAALIAGAGLASAQNVSQGREAPSPAPAAQQSAPAEKVAPMIAPKGGAEIKAPGTKTGQVDEKARKDGKTGKSEMKADPKAGSTAQKVVPGADKPGDAKPSTSGQGAAGAPASLTTEQRTTIRTVIKQQNVQPATNVNFTISVGTQVPRTVRFYPVFVELVQINPSWRGYEYFLVGDQIIVVNPRTLEIVAVLDA